jgi:hypothetical protein
MPLVGFEPTIPVFERAKTVHALDPLDCAATVIGTTTTTADSSVQFFVYLLAELNSQWPITESAGIQTTALRQHRTKEAKNGKRNNREKWIN